ncbi:response regulator transcription factor [Nitrospira sp. Kam-Ns4a]
MIESAHLHYARGEATAVSVLPGPSRAPCILVVDDDPDIRSILRDRLAAEGYAVETAADGAAALEALQTQAYIGVMLDLGLPDMDGLEVLRQLRHFHPALPVIIITANESRTREAQALDLNPQAILLKPFNFSLLQETLARCIPQDR